jgi:hypothetical protein
LFGGVVRGTHSAFDTVNNVRLVVAGHGDIYGKFVDVNGTPLTGHIAIWSVASGFGQFPTATFSQHLGGGAFLVTWNASTATPPYLNSAWGRVVSYTTSGHLASPAFQLSDTTTFAEVGAAPAVAYSPTNQAFLVAWQTAPPTYSIRGRILTVANLSAGTPFTISAGNAQYPSVAFNATTNQFGVGYSGFGDVSAFNAFALVSPAGSVVSRNTFNSASGTFITDLAVNPTTGRYVMTWSQGDGTRVAEFGADGTTVGVGVVSGALGGYDSGSLAYSAASGTFLVVGHGLTGNVAAAELSSRGNRISGVIEGSNAAPLPPTAFNGTYYPRVSYSSSRWTSTFSMYFTSAQSHHVTTTSVSGGGNSALPAPGAPPPPPTGGGGTTTPPPPTGCTSPSPGSGWTCVNGGWLPPSGGGTTTPPPSTGGCAGTAPFPGAVCQNGGWVPGTGGTTTPPPTGGCTTASPGAGWTCVNGGWQPPNSTGGSPGGGTGGCTSASPGTGWVCSNGGWLPPGSGGTTTPPPNTSSCTSASPGAGWVCSNGGWLPPGSGGSTPPPPTSSCTSPSPGAGWVCSNGGWLPPGSGGSTPPPPTSSCTSPSPGAGWVCSNGGWLPPGSGGSTPPPPTSSCTSPSPGAGWTCVNGGWIPGGTTAPPPPTSTCTTPSPGAGWTCRNGGWLPPGIASVTLTPLATLARNVDVSNNRRTALVPAPQPHHRSTVV